jgi:hypothetical protein
MKRKSLLILIIIGVLSYLFLDIQQVLMLVYKYVTNDEPAIVQKEGSPIVPGKPCLYPNGKAYFYPNSNRKGYVEVIVNKVCENPSQSLVTVERIRTIRPFKYHNVSYYPNEQLWLPSEHLQCQRKE